MDWKALETHVTELPQGRVHYREAGSGRIVTGPEGKAAVDADAIFVLSKI